MEYVVLVLLILAIFAVQSRIYRKYGLSRVEYSCYFSKDEVYEGEEIELIEEISNGKWLPVPWMKSEFALPKWLDFGESCSVVKNDTRYVTSFFSLKGFCKIHRSWKVICKKRGVYHLGEAVILAADLLGSTEVSSSRQFDSVLTVLPRPLPADIPEIASARLYGNSPIRRRLVPDPFFIEGIREALPGEPQGRVHWRATAREQKLMVFQPQDSTIKKAVLILNIQTREGELEHCIFPEKAEACIRICAYCAETAVQQEMPVRFYTNGEAEEPRHPVSVPEGSGIPHLMRILRRLSALELKNAVTIGEFLGGLMPECKEQNVLLVTSFIEDSILRFADCVRMNGGTVRILHLGSVPSQYRNFAIPVNFSAEQTGGTV